MPIGTDYTTGVSRLGQVNGQTGKRDIFLKQFSGEVLTAFEEKNIAMPLHRVRTISNGKSAQFPSLGTASAAYHTAGDVIYGGSVDHGEITVTVDDLLVSSTFIPKIDEAMNHYDVRSTYSKEMGNALANEADKNIFSTIYQGATQAASTGGDQNGYWSNADFASGAAGVQNIGSSYSSQDLVDNLLVTLQKFDEKNVDGEKYIVLTPEAYYKLFGANTNTIVSTAMNRDAGGNGSVALGQAPTIFGTKVLMSNHLPTADDRIDPINESGKTTPYTGTDSFDAALAGMIFTKDAAATVKLLDLGVESEYQIERQGTLMVAKYAMGHNVLRGKSAIALVAA